MLALFGGVVQKQAPCDVQLLEDLAKLPFSAPESAGAGTLIDMLDHSVQLILSFGAKQVLGRKEPATGVLKVTVSGKQNVENKSDKCKGKTPAMSHRPPRPPSGSLAQKIAAPSASHSTQPVSTPKPVQSAATPATLHAVTTNGPVTNTQKRKASDSKNNAS